MRHLFLYLGLIISTPGIYASQVSNQEICHRLAAMLQEEVRLLQGVTDQASAQAAAPQLARIVSELQSLNNVIEDDQKLWKYIENTPGAKQPLIDVLELLLVELQRMDSNRCYNVRALEAALRPQLIPAAA